LIEKQKPIDIEESHKQIDKIYKKKK
jgi:hypothetical protein